MFGEIKCRKKVALSVGPLYFAVRLLVAGYDIVKVRGIKFLKNFRSTVCDGVK